MSQSLTELQWYAVCKFWPLVAQRASAYSGRPLADVGPHNPFDAAVARGPIFAGKLDPESEEEREAIRFAELDPGEQEKHRREQERLRRIEATTASRFRTSLAQESAAHES